MKLWNNPFKRSQESKKSEIPVFPLHAVAYPGSLLSLKVFEQRYVNMMKSCIRDNLPFGVFLIREGEEVGDPAVPFDTGCLMRIDEWDMQQLGMYRLKTFATEKIKILNQYVGNNGLIMASVENLAPEPAEEIEVQYQDCIDVLRLVIDKVGEEHFARPFNFENAVWVSYRLAESLPIKLQAKQLMLEMNNANMRLKVLQNFLRQQGLQAR